MCHHAQLCHCVFLFLHARACVCACKLVKVMGIQFRALQKQCTLTMAEPPLHPLFFLASISSMNMSELKHRVIQSAWLVKKAGM